MEDCIFCKIIKGDIPSNKVYEDDTTLAFYDVNPVAPVHILVVPKVHIKSLAEVGDDQLELLGHLQGVIRDLAKKLGLKEGYRVVNNCGQQGGQSVGHLHYHLLGGRNLAWPPG